MGEYMAASRLRIKFEIRSSKSETSSKFKKRKYPKRSFRTFLLPSFVLVSDFGFGASDVRPRGRSYAASGIASTVWMGNDVGPTSPLRLNQRATMVIGFPASARLKLIT